METGSVRSLFTRTQKIVGCTILFAVWLTITLVFTFGSWSILPFAVDATGIQSDWTGIALATSLLFAFIVSGFITIVGMSVLALFIFGGAALFGFFRR